MGKRQTRELADSATIGAAALEDFAGALRRQLADGQRSVRVFDIGGSGVKTGLISCPALRDFLHFGDLSSREDLRELQWIEKPTLLGMAPGDDGFAAWLVEKLPRLVREVDDQRVAFGVSTAGDLNHATGVLEDWWSGGGHPRQWHDGRPNPLVADLMGLPPLRTFVLHDGSAHLLGCSRCAVPPPGLACLALGTGVGFGITDVAGAMVDPSSESGGRSHLLTGGAPVSGCPYQGIWKRWLEGGTNARVEAVLAQEFAGSKRPWRTPWTSLVLGRRGMELAEAAHNCPEPAGNAYSSTCDHVATDGAEAAARGGVADDEVLRSSAVRAYGEQWHHFLHTKFLPSFQSAGRRHRVDKVCFAGGIAEINWPTISEVLLDPDSCALRPLPEGIEEGSRKCLRPSSRKKDGQSTRTVVLPPAPCGSALIGAGLYALAGCAGCRPLRCPCKAWLQVQRGGTQRNGSPACSAEDPRHPARHSRQGADAAFDGG